MGNLIHVVKANKISCVLIVIFLVFGGCAPATTTATTSTTNCPTLSAEYEKGETSQGTNVTVPFKKLFKDNDTKLSEREKEKLNKYQVLFVKGFLSNIVKEIGGEYFDAQMSWLEEEQKGGAVYPGR